MTDPELAGPVKPFQVGPLLRVEFFKVADVLEPPHLDADVVGILGENFRAEADLFHELFRSDCFH